MPLTDFNTRKNRGDFIFEYYKKNFKYVQMFKDIL